MKMTCFDSAKSFQAHEKLALLGKVSLENFGAGARALFSIPCFPVLATNCILTWEHPPLTNPHQLPANQGQSFGQLKIPRAGHTENGLGSSEGRAWVVVQQGPPTWLWLPLSLGAQIPAPPGQEEAPLFLFPRGQEPSSTYEKLADFCEAMSLSAWPLSHCLLIAVLSAARGLLSALPRGALHLHLAYNCEQ